MKTMTPHRTSRPNSSVLPHSAVILAKPESPYWSFGAPRLLGLTAAFALALLTGCATNPGTDSTSAPLSVRAITGRVHGGQQPISGATIQLYAVGITGLHSPSTPLIASAVTTDINGGFNISGLWNCTDNTTTYGSNPELYLVATGGNPGFSTGTNNTAIAMIAALGPCGSIGPSTYILMNEVTTVAAAYAFAPFAADYAHIGASGANAPGLVNAFNNAALLANIATGTAPGAALPSNATAPSAALYTIANVIGSCINSTGTTSVCSGLFTSTTPSGGAAPTDTVGVSLSLAHNPGISVTSLYNNIPATPPFRPMLSAVPNDWTLSLNVTGGGLASPASVAIDASGNAWVANAGGAAITELAPSGTPLTGSSGYTGNNTIFGAQGIAIDKTGNVWLADTLLSSVIEIAVSSGAIQSATTFTAGGISGPTGIAVDSGNNIWVSNFAGGSVTQLSNTGAAVGNSPLTANGTLQSPAAIAIDSAGNAWTPDNSASNLAEFSTAQALLSGTGFTDSGMLAPTGVAIDSTNRAWVANAGTNSVSLFSSAGTALLTTPITGGGLSSPAGVAIDGSGTVWVANSQNSSQTAGSLSQLTSSSPSPLSPATGFGVLNQPAGLAIDNSGSIWTANSGDNSISIFIGLAAPVTLPLVTYAGP